jgi:hypothetical protein
MASAGRSEWRRNSAYLGRKWRYLEQIMADAEGLSNLRVSPSRARAFMVRLERRVP